MKLLKMQCFPVSCYYAQLSSSECAVLCLFSLNITMQAYSLRGKRTTILAGSVESGTVMMPSYVYSWLRLVRPRIRCSLTCRITYFPVSLVLEYVSVRHLLPVEVFWITYHLPRNCRTEFRKTQ